MHKALADQPYTCKYCLSGNAPAKRSLCLSPQTGSARRRPRTRVDGAREVLRQTRVPRRRPHAAVKRERRMLAGALRPAHALGSGLQSGVQGAASLPRPEPSVSRSWNADSRHQWGRGAV